MYLGQSRAQMRRHIVWPLIVMGVGGAVLWRESGEIAFDIFSYFRGCILLNQHGSGRVLAKDCQQSTTDAGGAYPGTNFVGDFDKPLPPGVDRL